MKLCVGGPREHVLWRKQQALLRRNREHCCCCRGSGRTLLCNGRLLWEELGYKRSGARLQEECCCGMGSTSSTCFFFSYTIVEALFLFIILQNCRRKRER